MAQDDRSGGSIPIVPILALLLFAGGLLVQHQALQSDRPVAQTHALTVPHYGQDVEARLWQDPLEAVQAADREQGGSSGKGVKEGDDLPCGNAAAPDCHSTVWLNKELEHPQGSKPGETILVLPVMIFGGPYAEDAEDRRRNRYAVLSNLIDSGYQPVYSRGLGFARFGNAENQRQGLPRLIPFERWDRIEGTKPASGYDHVFVLWLAEESFSPGAPENFRTLFKTLLPPDKAITVKIIGPGSQETADELWPLHDKADSAGLSCRDGEAEVWKDHCVELLAPRLTTPGGSPSALRFSPDDKRIVGALLGELQNRDLKLHPEQDAATCNAANNETLDHIAIVVEADTHYGRSLEKEFRSALACAGEAAQPPNLHIFRYFRGLDGKTSQAGEEAKKPSDAASPSAKGETTATEEKAQGQSQFDYLMRIALRVREQNDHLESKARAGLWPFDRDSSGRSIRAVVVLGSDVYDKLAILHALRERLPQAIFATTDLDAAFLQNDQLRWTRNLVVASGHDLRLHRNKKGDEEDPQRGAPPFRDTYQTATFLATSKALSKAADDPGIDACRISALEHPRLFEIGDGVAVKLDPIGGLVKSKSAMGIAVRLVTGVGLVLLFGLAFSWCLRYLLTQHWRVLLVGTALTAACAYYMVSVSGEPGEEPLRWLDGVSIWPSEFIRLAVVVLGAAFFIYARHRLNEGETRIAHEFFHQEPQTLPPNKPGLIALWDDLRACIAKDRKALWQRVFPGLSEGADRKSVDVTRLWADYQKWTSPATVFLRVAIGVALYLVLSVLLISLYPLIAPARGAVSIRLDILATGAANLILAVVLVAVLGRVAVSTLFLRCLYGGEDAKDSDWDRKTLRRYCGAYCRASRSYVDLMLSARMTEAVSDIVLYPFILTVLMLVARSRLFDNWVTPWGLMAVIVFGLALVIIRALVLRHSPERIRRYTIEELTNAEVRMRGGDGLKDDKSPDADMEASDPEKLKLMREAAANLRRGAFAPLNEQPIIRALVLPFGGAGALSILEYLLMAKG
jgi:hypothetical protein